MADETCKARYERPGGRQPGDRIVECHLQAGHPGDHEEDGTEVTWLDRDRTRSCRACEAGPHTCGLPAYDDAIRNSIERWIKAAGERAERDTPAAEANVHYRDGMERVYRAIWPDREVRRG